MMERPGERVLRIGAVAHGFHGPRRAKSAAGTVDGHRPVTVDDACAFVARTTHGLTSVFEASRCAPPGHTLGWHHSFVHQAAIASGQICAPDFADVLYVQEVLEAVATSAKTGTWQTVSKPTALPALPSSAVVWHE